MMNRKSLHTMLYVLVFLLVGGSLVGAVDVAPRISDREIIEKLSTLESGQRAIDQRLTDLRSEMKSGQEALRSEMKSGMQALGKRIDDSNHTMLALFGALVTLLVALFAYIAWDRRTMLKPVMDQLNRLESEVIHDLELSRPDGSKLTRLVHVMRDLARTDDKIASVLRSFSLL